MYYSCNIEILQAAETYKREGVSDEAVELNCTSKYSSVVISLIVWEVLRHAV